MVKPYSPEQFWKLYKKIPQELQDALFDEEIGNGIYEVCEKNDILKEHDQVIALVSNVLLGTLPLEEFQKTLVKELKLKEDVGKKIAQEIHRFAFYPIKESLRELYGAEVFSKDVKKTLPLTEKEPEKKSIPTGPDTYRESIE